MKRGHPELSPSTSLGPPPSGIKYYPEVLAAGDAQFFRKVFDHYSGRTNQTLEERGASPIIHLKKLNIWINSPLCPTGG
ncbi:hypothetical protein BT93_F2780 [Corymbia citriodora subsp. variegata]|nr:hypothetical protein BT93_F2780 [Corymbia citriodora subsp. variegata]